MKTTIVPVLAVSKGIHGVIVDLEIESRKGAGTLFLDIKLSSSQGARQVISTAFSLLNIKNIDMLIRVKGGKHKCLCGNSLALPVYLGMHACVHDLQLKPKTFATGGIDNKGIITPVGKVAEKIKAILGRADMLLVPKGQGLPVEGIKIIEVTDLQGAIKLALKK
jgi:predicted S18 family serine protease